MFPVEVFVLESVCGWVPLTEWVDQVGGFEPEASLPFWILILSQFEVDDRTQHQKAPS